MKMVIYSSAALIAAIAGAWLCGKRKSPILRNKELRAALSENQIDGMVEDSFPASDPPSTY